MKHKKVDIKDIITYFTEEEIAENIRRTNLMDKLGIILYFDKSDNNSKEKEYTDPYFKITDSQFKQLNTQYKCFADYDRDKNTANYLICNDKPIPQDLYNKLAQTRIELEQAGLLPPYKE